MRNLFLPVSCEVLRLLRQAGFSILRAVQWELGAPDGRVVFLMLPWISARSDFTRALIRLEFLELFVLFEAETVTFPPAPGVAESSSESNCAELLTLIVAPVVLTVLPPAVTVADEIVELLNDGAPDRALVVAPLPPKVPVVLPLPPEPV